MAVELRLCLLGRFEAFVAGRRVPDGSWRGNMAKALVKLLALSPGHSLHREQLMDALWPDLAPDAAAANLRKAVHFARRATAPSCVDSRHEVLGLAGDRLWVDVDAFTAAAAAGDLPAALDLYRGELLPEDRFAPWADEHRQRLQARCAEVLFARAREMTAEGELAGAAELLERSIGLDPFDERAVGELMRCYAAAGQRHLALARYGQLEARLATDLGVGPGSQLRRLRTEVADGSLSPRRPIGRLRPTWPADAVDEHKLVSIAIFDAIAAPDAVEPELIRSEHDRWATLATEVVEAWGGVADRLTGGSLLAVFGAPLAHEDDATRAVHSASEVVQRSTLAVRVGVATGEVVVAVGEGGGFAGGLAGDAVEAAGFLRERARPATVLVAERTCRLTDGLSFGDPGRLRRPGGAQLWARELLAMSGGLSARTRRTPSPLVGREIQMRLLQDLFVEVADTGRARRVQIVGAAGVGKSRLVEEATAAMVTLRSDTVVLRGRCVAAGHGATFRALGEIVRQACGVSVSDPIGEARAKLQSGLGRILGRVPAAGRLDTAVDALTVTAGIASAEPLFELLEPVAAADELRRAWLRFAAGCAAAGPTMLVVEDTHWADDDLRQVLGVIAAGVSGPLLLLTTARHPHVPSERMHRDRGLAPVSITLRPLSEEHSSALLRSLDADHALGDAVLDQILARAEGNPFFMEELISHAAGQGGGALPDTVHAVLAARLDSVSAVEKLILQQAAVVGRVFWPAALEDALGDGSVDLHLRRLERGGFVTRRRVSALPGQTEYRFRHALTQEVAYASVPSARRARAHAAVGWWLEQVDGSHTHQFTEVLADHFAAAAAGDVAALAWPNPTDRERVRSTAVRYLMQAGDTARRGFAVSRAVELHDHARTLAATPAERMSALEALGGDHAAAFTGERAEDCFRQRSR